MEIDSNSIEAAKLDDVRRLAETGSADVLRAQSAISPMPQAPGFDAVRIVTAQLHKLPHSPNDPVGTEIMIGPGAAKPLWLDIPILVSDIPLPNLSENAKMALAAGAEQAGTGICSGEGAILDDLPRENSRCFFELSTGNSGYDDAQLMNYHAFHFRAGHSVNGVKIQGKPASLSPTRFSEFTCLADFRSCAAHVRETTGGIPVGFKISPQHIEKDISIAVAAGADYLMLDARNSGEELAPMFGDHVSIPVVPAIVRARAQLNAIGADDVSLIITGGLRTGPDFVKALALGADAIAVTSSALAAIGDASEVTSAANRLRNFFNGSTELMKIAARACGHNHLSQFSMEDLTTFDDQVHKLTGISWAGVKQTNFSS